MKKLLTLFVLLFAVTTNASAALSRPYHWTLKFRSGWNQECFEALSDLMSRGGYKVDEVKVRNLCDCSSGIIQDRYSEQQVIAFGLNPPADFIAWSKESVKMCLEPMTDPI